MQGLGLGVRIFSLIIHGTIRGINPKGGVAGRMVIRKGDYLVVDGCVGCLPFAGVGMEV